MVALDKYRRVTPAKTEKAEGKDDEIRITAKGRAATYVSYASKLFNEKEMNEFTLKATGAALVTAVTVAEVLKRRFKGLHQITKLGSVEVEDEWEPLEEGLEPVGGYVLGRNLLVLLVWRIIGCRDSVGIISDVEWGGRDYIGGGRW